MNENPEDSGQFKMRMDDEVEPSPIVSHVDDLRIEKLSQRMTLVTILIPVLIVVVLVMAYMDIKRRVVKTEDTGQLTAQTLSQDLESRFSNLSLGQALIEENLARFMDQTHQTMAKVQVNLKNLDDSLKKSSQRMASRKDMTAAKAKMDKDLNNVAQSIDALNAQWAQLHDEMQSRLDGIDQHLSDAKEQTEQMDAKLTKVASSKIDKEAMDVALQLEILKLKQGLKVEMEDVRTKINALDARLKKQEVRIARPPAAPKPPSPPPAGSQGALKEQTIQQ